MKRLVFVGVALAGVFGIGALMLTLSLFSTGMGIVRAHWSTLAGTECVQVVRGLARVEPWVQGDPAKHWDRVRQVCLSRQDPSAAETMNERRES